MDSALKALGLSVDGKVAADLGANVGGFTDCLLQRGVSRVYAVDTAYGVLDWKLRQDPRVVVLERSNALHVVLPESVDLAVVDVGWTRLGLILPRSLAMLGVNGDVVALLKPQYEAEPLERNRGVVVTRCVADVVSRVVNTMAASGISVSKQVESQVPGNAGNREFFLLIEKR